MNVFITGGCGFIGSHLAERLLERGDRVQVLDDLSTGSMENIAHLVGRPGFSYRIGSALDAPRSAREMRAPRHLWHFRRQRERFHHWRVRVHWLASR